MYDIKTRYLASAFLDADSITAEPDHTAGVLKALNDDRFLPTPVFENVGGKMAQRIGFTSLKDGWTLTLTGKRFDVTLLPVKPAGDNMGDFAAFCNAASAKLNATLSYFNRKAHRLAAIREGLLPEMEAGRLNDIAIRLLKLTPTFAANPPFEWIWRVASLVDRPFANLVEPTNTVVTARRISGVLTLESEEGAEFDRIRIDLDINTSTRNVRARFGETEISAFFQVAAEWHASLEAEVMAFIEENRSDA